MAVPLEPPDRSEKLPAVECVVRARMPTTLGVELYLHVYRNDMDDKEHMALVFGDSWRSRSLYARKDHETEMDRVVRGVYCGRLTPGRVHVDDVLQWSLATATVDGTGGTGNVKRPRDDALLPENLSNGLCSTQAPNTIQEQGPHSSEPSKKCSEPPLVRIHSECCTGDTFWSARCDCGEQLGEAARLMSSALSQSPSPSPGGIIVYLRQEGRGIGLVSKLKACNLQDMGFDTVDANLLLNEPVDGRSYSVATSILLDLGCGGERGIKLLTNNPEKVKAVEGVGQGIKVKQRVPLTPLAWKTEGKGGVNGAEVQQYLHTKATKMGHLMEGAGLH